MVEGLGDGRGWKKGGREKPPRTGSRWQASRLERGQAQPVHMYILCLISTNYISEANYITWRRDYHPARGWRKTRRWR